MNDYVSFFSEINLGNIAETGGKGANLGELIDAGFPVPPGFCVKVRAFEKFLEPGERKFTKILIDAT